MQAELMASCAAHKLFVIIGPVKLSSSWESLRVELSAHLNLQLDFKLEKTRFRTGSAARAAQGGM